MFLCPCYLSVAKQRLTNVGNWSRLLLVWVLAYSSSYPELCLCFVTLPPYHSWLIGEDLKLSWAQRIFLRDREVWWIELDGWLSWKLYRGFQRFHVSWALVLSSLFGCVNHLGNPSLYYFFKLTRVTDLLLFANKRTLMSRLIPKM